MRPTIDPALTRRGNLSNNPYLDTNLLYMGKVIASHPSTGTVDIAIDGSNGQGGIYKNVPVMSWSMGTQTGESYFPSVDLAAPIPQSQGTFDQPLSSGKSDVWCVVGHLNARSQRPIVLGFLNPFSQNTRSSQVGDHVSVHESGVYQITTQSGHYEFHLPDGSYIIFATDSTPINMQSKNANWNPKTTTTSYNVTVNVNGAVTINAPEVYIGTSQGNGKPVARQGDAVVNGVITGGSSKVYAG